jgi:Tol biopolymer transport system component
MLLRWVFWPIAALVVVISVLFISDKKTANGALSCLEFKDADLNRGMIDLNTGAIVRIYATAPPKEQWWFGSFAVSPNGRYIAYPSRGENEMSYRLIVKSARTAAGSAWVLRKHFVSADIRDYAWSPDSHSLAFHWRSVGGTLDFVSVTDIYGNEQTVPISVQSRESIIVALHGWSADGRYLAVSTLDQNTMQREIIILAWPGFRRIRVFSQVTRLVPRSFGGPVTPPDTVQWGAKDNWLAFPTKTFGGKYTMTLFSPGENRELTFDLSQANVDDDTEWPWLELRWSPDGRYVATIIKVNAGEPLYMLQQLDIVGIDGTAIKVTEKAAFYMVLSGRCCLPLADWSPDGRSLLYVEAISQRNTGDLMAYRINERKAITIQQDILMNPNYSKDKRYVFFKRKDGNKTYVHAVNTTNLSQIVAGASYNQSMMQVYGDWSSEGEWLILTEDYVVTWAVNPKSGLKRALPNGFINGYTFWAQNNRFVGNIVKNYGPQTIKMLSLDDGSSREIVLDPAIGYSSAYVDRTFISISPDGSLLAIPDTSTRRLHIVRSDGTLLWRIDNFSAPDQYFRFTPCD